MFSLVLLAALTLGQESFSPETGRPYYVVKLHTVKHDGLTFTVRGYVADPATGTVTWETAEPFNARSYADAKARSLVVHARGHVANFGMEPGRMRTGPVYTASSDKAHKFFQEAQEASGQGNKIHVTVIGTDADRAAVVKDLASNPALLALKPSLFVQDYRPGEWPVDASLGFATDGKPTIIIQTAKGVHDPKGGRVVYRASDYAMGPEALAEEIRKANPDYKPSADPGPAAGNPSASSRPCPFGFDSSHWPFLIATGIGLAVLSKLPRKGA